jgi:hypothetical protein
VEHAQCFPTYQLASLPLHRLASNLVTTIHGTNQTHPQCSSFSVWALRAVYRPLTTKHGCQVTSTHVACLKGTAFTPRWKCWQYKQHLNYGPRVTGCCWFQWLLTHPMVFTATAHTNWLLHVTKSKCEGIHNNYSITAFATGLSLIIQGSPTGCVPVCDLQASTTRWPRAEFVWCTTEKKYTGMCCYIQIISC